MQSNAIKLMRAETFYLLMSRSEVAQRSPLRVSERRNERDELSDGRSACSTTAGTAGNVAGVHVTVKHLLVNAPGRAVYQNV